MTRHLRSFTVIAAAAAAASLGSSAAAHNGEFPIDICLTASDLDPCVNHVDDQGDGWFLADIASIHPDLGPLPFEVGQEFRVTGVYCESCIQTFCGSFEGFIFHAELVPCRAGDIDADGDVSVNDLVAVITNWGGCPEGPALCPADLDANGAVDVDDLIAVIVNM